LLAGPAAAFTASVTWAYATARYSRAARDVGATRVNAMRTVVALPVFLVLYAVAGTGPVLSRLDVTRTLFLVVSVLSSYGGADVLFLVAARRIGISTALSIASVYPLWAALWGTVFDHEPVGALRALGTLCAVGGVIWLVRLSGETATGKPRDWWGIALAALTSVLWAANSVGVKQGAAGLDPFGVTAFRFFIGFSIVVPQLWLPRSRSLPRAPRGGWVPLLPAFVADSVFGSLAYVYGLSHTDLAVGATLSSLAPLVSVPFAIALGEERWSLPRFTAIVVTVSGIGVLMTSTAP
jgi:drug/metabolite transporter (DMT)-like permease